MLEMILWLNVHVSPLAMCIAMPTLVSYQDHSRPVSPVAGPKQLTILEVSTHNLLGSASIAMNGYTDVEMCVRISDPSLLIDQVSLFHPLRKPEDMSSFPLSVLLLLSGIRW